MLQRKARGMTMITAWPVVIRDRIVQAFKPGGSPDAEAPFRTLRRHAWVSQGVRVTLFVVAASQAS